MSSPPVGSISVSYSCGPRPRSPSDGRPPNRKGRAARCRSSSTKKVQRSLSMISAVLSLDPTAKPLPVIRPLMEAAIPRTCSSGKPGINSLANRRDTTSWSTSRAQRRWNIHLFPHSSPNSSNSSDKNFSSGPGGWMNGSGNCASNASMIGVESCMAFPSGDTTNGTICSFAKRLNSCSCSSSLPSWRSFIASPVRGIHS
mmetsp:Transcript_61257/g.200270  ORF Transcript_61257/g.200270 Transcript_61257/m.200270 type:complete len:200 (+) Transcript_61257:387-986(+)